MEPSPPLADPAGDGGLSREIQALRAAIAVRVPRRIAPPRGERVQAAVCVPLHAGPRGLEVWAIKRPDDMRDHAGELAFPGGKPDASDRDLAETALREMEEELGIRRDQVRLLGALTPVPTATSRFTLNPFVALVDAEAVARPQGGVGVPALPGRRPEGGSPPFRTSAEVAALIRMPVADFFAGRVPYRAVELPGGLRSPIFDFEVGSMYGASAHVMEEVLDVYAGVHHLAMPAPVPTTEIPWM